MGLLVRLGPVEMGPWILGTAAKWGGNHAARLLPVEGPVSEEHRTRRVAEIEDEDVVATPPAVRGVIAASADNVGDARVAFPPTLMGPGEGACGPRFGSNNRVASSNGPDAHRAAGFVTFQISCAELA